MTILEVLEDARNTLREDKIFANYTAEEQLSKAIILLKNGASVLDEFDESKLTATAIKED